MNTYKSSIVTKYGDIENVKKDSEILRDIFFRQGASLLIDAISENSAMAFNLNVTDRERLINSLVNELMESLCERI
jgi:hypothetical protein